MSQATVAPWSVQRDGCGQCLPASKQTLSSDATWSFHEARNFLEEEWREALGRQSLPPLTEMMSYALSGGKRLRGLLLMAVADSCNGSRQQAREAAVAIEMLHAASLVVDDLPAFDDSSERRGAPSVHKRFGEDAAVLTAHALVASAFELVSQIASEPDRLLRIIRRLASAIGARGMARAEAVDPHSVNPCDYYLAPDTHVRALKTGGLFQLAAHMGAVLAGAEPDLAADLAQLGLGLGICFQLADDFRDELMDDSARRLLRETSRRNWQECAGLFELVRGRLPRPHPMDTWLSAFYEAGAEVDKA
jgi:geranylgeranyl pyrophosphate synthase